MHANLLAFNNLFAANGNVSTLASKSAPTQNNGKFAAILPDQTQQSEAPEITTSYNELVVVQNKPSEDSSNFAVKKITSQLTQKALGEQLDEQDIPSDYVSQIPSINPVLAQLLAAANLGKGEEVPAALVQPQTSQKSALFKSNLLADGSPVSALLKDNLPANGNPIPALLKDNLPADGSPVSALLKDNLPANGSPVSALLKNVLPANDSQESVSIEDNLPKSAANQSQIGLIRQAEQELLSPQVSSETISSDALPAEGKTAIKTETAGKVPSVETKPANQNLPKELIPLPQAANTDKKITVADERPAAADKPPVLSNEKIIISDNETFDAALRSSSIFRSRATAENGPLHSTSIPQNAPEEPPKPLISIEKPDETKIPDQRKPDGTYGFSESTDAALRSSSLHSTNNGKEQGSNLSDSLLDSKLSQLQVKASIKQTNDQSSDGGSSPAARESGIGYFESSLPGKSGIEPRTPNNEPLTTNQESPAATVSEQIQSSIQGSLRQGDQQITVRLNPPELGKVLIKIHERGSQVTGLLEVSKSQTKYEIQQALPEIIQNLQNLGIQVKKIEVILTGPDLTGQQAHNNQSLQDGSASHQNAARDSSLVSHGLFNKLNTNDYLLSTDDYKQRDILITDKSIDILV